MSRNFDDMMRSTGRIPESEMDEIRKKRMQERRYITLFGGKNDTEEEGLPDEYFEDEFFGTEEDERSLRAERERERQDKKDRLESNLYFFSFIFILVSAGVGLFVLIGRLIAYPFVKKLAKSFDNW